MNFLQHLTSVFKRHKLGATMSAILAIALISIALVEAEMVKTATYLLVMFICFIVSEYIFFRGKPSFGKWHIKKPKKELGIVIAVVVIATLLMIYWFVFVDRQNVNRAAQITAGIFRVIFVFPIFLLVYFLGFKKYRMREIGIWGFNYWYVSISIILLLGGTTYLFFPESLQFKQQLLSNGMIGFVVLGFLVAAIPEEITRTLFQSRLGTVISNKSIAWFVVSLVWALQHIPSFVFGSDGDYYGATISALGILPIGLLWGYLNERYKSIVPSVIIHGTNLWGLHNIF